MRSLKRNMRTPSCTSLARWRPTWCAWGAACATPQRTCLSTLASRSTPSCELFRHVLSTVSLFWRMSCAGSRSFKPGRTLTAAVTLKLPFAADVLLHRSCGCAPCLDSWAANPDHSVWNGVLASSYVFEQPAMRCVQRKVLQAGSIRGQRQGKHGWQAGERMDGPPAHDCRLCSHHRLPWPCLQSSM